MVVLPQPPFWLHTAMAGGLCLNATRSRAHIRDWQSVESPGISADPGTVSGELLEPGGLELRNGPPFMQQVQRGRGFADETNYGEYRPISIPTNAMSAAPAAPAAQPQASPVAGLMVQPPPGDGSNPPVGLEEPDDAGVGVRIHCASPRRGLRPRRPANG